jgi:hypothetical protein
MPVVVAAAAAQATGRLHGVVSDDSGGVLPGVTVTVAAPDGETLAFATTDAVGAYDVQVPAGPARVTFSLEGFSSSVLDAAVTHDAVTSLPARLAVAPQSETVVVRGDAPSERRAPQTPPPPPITPVPLHDRDSICGPAKLSATPESLGIVTARRSEPGPELFSNDDQVIVDGGIETGLSVGMNVVARRTYRISGSSDSATGEHTAGVLQIIATSDRTSLAVVVYACDEIRRGDRLASFAPEPVRAPEPLGAAAFDSAARVLFADAGQLVGAPHRFMVVDRGRRSGLRPGQRLTLFRRGHQDDRSPIVIGDAVVVAARDDSATIRIDHATDAIEPGDGAAPQRVRTLAP